MLVKALVRLLLVGHLVAVSVGQGVRGTDLDLADVGSVAILSASIILACNG